MLMSEEELSVEVGQVNRVEVNDVNLAEAVKDQVFQQLASDTSSAHHEDSRLWSRLAFKIELAEKRKAENVN